MKIGEWIEWNRRRRERERKARDEKQRRKRERNYRDRLGGYDRMERGGLKRGLAGLGP